MIDLLLLLGLAAVLNWAVLDVYFYSIVFEPLREYSKGWQHSSGWWLQHFRYMLDCPLCFSHWSAAFILAVLSLCGSWGWLPATLHPLLAVVFIPAVARTSLVIRDYSLPPLVNVHTPEEQSELESGSITTVSHEECP